MAIASKNKTGREVTMLKTLPFNVIADQTDYTLGVPDDLIQTSPVAPHASEAALEWSQPSHDVPPISHYHSMNAFSERDKIIAYMDLAGSKKKDIAKAVNVSYQTVAIVQRKPEYRLFVAEEGKIIRQGMHQSIQERIMGDGHRNIDVLMQIRDGVEDQSGIPDWGNRRAAAVELFARQYPKITKTESNEHHIYQFESNTLKNMMKTMAGAMEVNTNGKSTQEVIDLLAKELPRAGGNESD